MCEHQCHIPRFSVSRAPKQQVLSAGPFWEPGKPCGSTRHVCSSVGHQGCSQQDMLGLEKPFPGYGLLSRMSKLQNGQGRGESQQSTNRAGAKSRQTNLPNADSSHLGVSYSALLVGLVPSSQLRLVQKQTLQFPLCAYSSKHLKPLNPEELRLTQQLCGETEVREKRVTQALSDPQCQK